MTDAATVRSIEVDVSANTLRLLVGDGDATVSMHVPATIDIGTGGRLIGVEVPSGYLDVMAPEGGTEHLTRSATAAVVIERAGERGALVAVTVPRRGAGYEITYPSGNQ